MTETGQLLPYSLHIRLQFRVIVDAVFLADFRICLAPDSYFLFFGHQGHFLLAADRIGCTTRQQG